MMGKPILNNQSHRLFSNIFILSHTLNMTYPWLIKEQNFYLLVLYALKIA